MPIRIDPRAFPISHTLVQKSAILVLTFLAGMGVANGFATGAALHHAWEECGVLIRNDAKVRITDRQQILKNIKTIVPVVFTEAQILKQIDDKIDVLIKQRQKTVQDFKSKITPP
jgi:hypothetical protein